MRQLYVRRNPAGRVVFLLAKVTDDLFMTGYVEAIRKFLNNIKARFEISKVIIEKDTVLNGYNTDTDNGDVPISMRTYGKKISYIHLEEDRRKKQSERVTDEERASF